MKRNLVILTIMAILVSCGKENGAKLQTQTIDSDLATLISSVSKSSSTSKGAVNVSSATGALIWGGDGKMGARECLIWTFYVKNDAGVTLKRVVREEASESIFQMSPQAIQVGSTTNNYRDGLVFTAPYASCRIKITGSVKECNGTAVENFHIEQTLVRNEFQFKRNLMGGRAVIRGAIRTVGR